MVLSRRFEFGLPDVDDDYLPLYGGKVWIHADNGEKLSISYGGNAYFSRPQVTRL